MGVGVNGWTLSVNHKDEYNIGKHYRVAVLFVCLFLGGRDNNYNSNNNNNKLKTGL